MPGPKLPNVAELLQAGINPKTGLPIKLGGDPAQLKSDIRKILRIVDEQNAVNRYTWYNLPDTLSGELIERILYYRGQAAFFYMEADNSFYFLPYALDGSIDVYGRYTGITPLPFNGTASDGKEKPWIVGLHKKPIYGIKYDELKYEDITNSCVLLKDYTNQLSMTNIPRANLNDPLITAEAECVPFMRTSMILGTGIKGMRVNDADQAGSVRDAAVSMESAALSGQGYVPIIGNIEFQELTDGANLKGADYMQAMQSLDNLRLSTYGLDNGGLFEKKAHMLEQEAALNGGSIGLVYADGLRIRQEFCNIVNSIWGLGIAVMPSESAMGGDINHDGVGFDIGTSQGASAYSTATDGGDDNATNV